MPLIGASQYTSGFSPTSIPGCVLWLDAADSRTITSSGGAVSQWSDKSASSNHAFQTNASFRPTTSNDGIYPAISFTSSATQHMLGGPLLTSTSYSIFCVSRSRTSNALQFIFFDYKKGPGGPGQNFVQHAVNDVGHVVADFIYADQSPSTTKAIQSGISVSTNRFLQTMVDSPSNTTQNFFVNGTSYTTTFTNNGTANIATDSAGYALGCIRAPGAVLALTLNGFIYEVITYLFEVSHPQRQAVEGYLARKWGLGSNFPATQPFRTLPPFMRPFQPTDISGCTLWLDALDPCGSGVRPGFGTNITTWVDKSGLGNSTTAVSGAVTFISNAINSVPALAFSNTYFTGPFATTYTGSNIQAFAVATLNSGAGAYARLLSLGVLGSNDFNNPSYTFMFLRAGPGSSDLQIGRNNAYAAAATSGFDIPFIVQSAHTVNIESIGVNGTEPTTADTGTTAGFNIAAYGIGTHVVTSDGSSRWQGNIGEIIYYTTALSRGERQQVETYLANKWRMRGSMASGHYARLAPALSPAFAPQMVRSCVLWLDAADPSTITRSGSNVSEWNDKSGNGRNLTNASFSTPIYASNGVTFTGGAGMGFTAGLPSSYDIFAVAAPLASTASWRTLMQVAGGTATHTILVETGSTRLGSWFNQFNQFGSLTWGGSNALLFARLNSNLTMNAALNGTLALTSATPTLGAATTGAINIGNAVGSGQPWGTLYEYIIYDGALTTTERQIVEGYLAWKWGLVNSLPAGHPFRRFKP